MTSSIVKKCLKEAEKYLTEDPSHGFGHVNNLFKLVDYLTEKENLGGKIDKEIIRLAIIFHDFGRMNYLSNRNIDDHDFRSAAIAEKILKKFNYCKASLVIEIILGHEKKKKRQNLEAIIFQDSDILDVLGAIGIGRTFTYGGQINRGLAGSMKRLLWKSFRDKPQTKTAKSMAIKRRNFIKKFVKEYNKEIKLNA